MTEQITRAVNEIDAILDRTNWHMTLPDPALTVTMVEAKAKLMEASKKLYAVETRIKQLESST